MRSWPGELLATKFKDACIGHQREPNDMGDYVMGTEDCLYLNVYAPMKKTNAPYPVIFYIYGGAFQYSTLTDFGQQYLIEHDVVYVSFNYRLGVLGFLSTEDDIISGNMGLKDQVAALRWVSENIECFGGDPNRVTLFGLSAGGASVHYHYLSRSTAGLFRTGVSLSGTALDPWTQAKNSREKAIKLGELMNCPTRDVRQMIKCLKDKPAHALVKAQIKFMVWTRKITMHIQASNFKLQ